MQVFAYAKLTFQLPFSLCMLKVPKIARVSVTVQQVLMISIKIFIIIECCSSMDLNSNFESSLLDMFVVGFGRRAMNTQTPIHTILWEHFL